MRRSLLVTAIVAAGAPWLAALTLPRSAATLPADGPSTLAPQAVPAPSPVVRFGDARLSTGVRLRFAEQGDPSGKVVIFLHGYSDSWFSFSRVMPLFPASWHVYALDQRGHGDSDRPRAGYGMRDLAADVVAFMDAKGIRTATVVGHSMGGFVAEQVALLAPDRVERLVTICSGARIQDIGPFADLRDAVASFGDTVPVEFIREFQQSTIMQPVPDDFFARVVDESRKLPTHVWKGIMAGMMETPAPTGLARTGIPTLLLFGERDAVFEKPAQDALRALVPAAQVKVYAETGHTPHWERPDEFARDLASFVETGSVR
jgi:non-heme chloroperoxidase